MAGTRPLALAALLALPCTGCILDHAVTQTYYVGVADPLGQLPPSLYRITLRGESTWFNTTRYASGWVKSELVDSLQSRIHFDDDGEVQVDAGSESVSLGSDRRLWLFGPEGFRKAPRDHRLVVVLGASPKAFFQAADEVLGQLSLARNLDRGNAGALHDEALAGLVELMREQETLTAATTGGAK